MEGFTFDRGFVSPYMVTDTGRMEAVLNKPAIVVTDKKISNIQEISSLLEQLVAAGKKELILIAEDVEGEAMTMLVLNKLKGVFNTVAVKAPSFGERRKDVLSDIAVLTGATVIAEEQGITFENATMDMIGSARKVIVDKDNTTIIEGAGKDSAVKARIAEINLQIKSVSSEYDKEALEKRRASLGGKVAVIKVGGASETEIEEKKFRVDDAVAAVKAAMDEGIVPGGGVTLVDLSSQIKALKNETENVGAQLLAKALEQPFRILMENSGQNPDEWLPQVKKAKAGQGVNVNNPVKLVDMKSAGVIDPVLVTK